MQEQLIRKYENYSSEHENHNVQYWTIIVTCWWGFIDIDGFACAIAYAELLRLEWNDATAVLTDPLNASVTHEIRALGAEFSTVLKSWESYVIVDMSDPDKIQEFAPLDTVCEIYDHHFGFEEYWKYRLGKLAKIEPIGAAATLIWEEFKSRNLSNKISHISSILLAHAILSNTVNFLVGISHKRDREALSELVEIAELEENWIASYFYSEQKYIEANPREAILNDTKLLSLPPFGRIAFSQCEIWDSTEFREMVPFKSILNLPDTDSWILNCVDIQKWETRIHSNHRWMIERLKTAFDWIYDWNELYIKKVVLRKEILPILKSE